MPSPEQIRETHEITLWVIDLVRSRHDKPSADHMVEIWRSVKDSTFGAVDLCRALDTAVEIIVDLLAGSVDAWISDAETLVRLDADIHGLLRNGPSDARDRLTPATDPRATTPKETP